MPITSTEPGTPGFIWMYIPGSRDAVPVATRIISSHIQHTKVVSLIAVPAIEELPFDIVLINSYPREPGNSANRPPGMPGMMPPPDIVAPVGIKLFWIPHEAIQPAENANHHVDFADFFAEPDLRLHYTRLAWLYPHISEEISPGRQAEIRRTRSPRPGLSLRQLDRSRSR